MRRIRFIKHAQQCGFSLAEIRELVTLKAAQDACCADVRSVAIQTRLRIVHKLGALQAMSRALDALIDRCQGGERATDECPILEALEQSLEERPRDEGQHRSVRRAGV